MYVCMYALIKLIGGRSWETWLPKNALSSAVAITRCFFFQLGLVADRFGAVAAQEAAGFSLHVGGKEVGNCC